jgi:hypothetical protein
MLGQELRKSRLAPVASAGYDGGYAMNADVIKTSRLNGLHAKGRLQPSELVWVPGTTEGNNLVASAWLVHGFGRAMSCS